MRKPIIQITNLVKKYGDTEVLNNLNLNIYPGDRIALLGVNGSGKTTLLEIIVGLLNLTSGKIAYLPNKTAFLQNALVIFQVGVYPAKMTVKNLVKFYHDFYFKSCDYQTVAKIVDILGLKLLWSKKVNNLSFGQKKKVEALVTLTVNNDFYFIDELTAGMDIDARVQIPAMFRKQFAKNPNQGMIWITHDPNEIESLCNRVILLSKETKNILFDGTVAEVKNQFKTVRNMLEVHLKKELDF